MASPELLRREWSTELFRAYDKDKSGDITSDEFLEILKMLDPTLVAEDVERTFNAVGASGSLDEEHLWLWCASVFGDFSDSEFAEQLQDMILPLSVLGPFCLIAPLCHCPQHQNRIRNNHH